MPLSQKQMEYLALAWQCFESEPKIDYDKFKTVAGLASANSARELVRVTKKKLREEYGALSNGVKDSNVRNAATPTPTPTATPRKRGKKDEGEGEGSPAKKARTPKGRKGLASPTKVKVDEGHAVGGEAEEDEDILA